VSDAFSFSSLLPSPLSFLHITLLWTTGLSLAILPSNLSSLFRSLDYLVYLLFFICSPSVSRLPYLISPPILVPVFFVLVSLILWLPDSSLRRQAYNNRSPTLPMVSRYPGKESFLEKSYSPGILPGHFPTNCRQWETRSGVEFALVDCFHSVVSELNPKFSIGVSWTMLYGVLPARCQ
jgi:hypothetical protein